MCCLCFDGECRSRLRRFIRSHISRRIAYVTYSHPGTKMIRPLYHSYSIQTFHHSNPNSTISQHISSPVSKTSPHNPNCHPKAAIMSQHTNTRLMDTSPGGESVNQHVNPNPIPIPIPNIPLTAS